MQRLRESRLVALRSNVAVTYEGCGTTKTSPETDISLEFAGDAFEPLLARNEPSRIEYLVNDDETDDQFTLVFLDAGFSFLHMMVINIPGNDLSRGEVKNANTHLCFKG